jgi:hypothetical protein
VGIAQCLSVMDKKANCCPGCEQLLARVAALEKLVYGERGRQRPGRPDQASAVDTGGARSRRWTPSEVTPNLAHYFRQIKRAPVLQRGRVRMVFRRENILAAEEADVAHFVSGDMRRSKGVAVDLAEAFGAVGEVPEGGFDIATVVPQVKGDKRLLNVVVKKRFFHKFRFRPEEYLVGARASLGALRDFCVAEEIRSLALVKLGASLEKLNWKFTQQELLDVFADVPWDMTLVVYRRPRVPKPARKGRRCLTLADFVPPVLAAAASGGRDGPLPPPLPPPLPVVVPSEVGRGDDQDPDGTRMDGLPAVNGVGSWGVLRSGRSQPARSSAASESLAAQPAGASAEKANNSAPALHPAGSPPPLHQPVSGTNACSIA